MVQWFTELLYQCRVPLTLPMPECHLPVPSYHLPYHTHYYLTVMLLLKMLNGKDFILYQMIDILSSPSLYLKCN